MTHRHKVATKSTWLLPLRANLQASKCCSATNYLTDASDINIKYTLHKFFNII